jgi:putative NIF3 family GTP cyclohydrolase 1 type 2
MRIRELYDLIDTAAPFRLQEEYDNAGLILGSMEDDVRGVLLCLDVTHETVEEADRVGANLILSHHPPFSGRSRDWTRSSIRRCWRRFVWIWRCWQHTRTSTQPPAV